MSLRFSFGYHSERSRGIFVFIVYCLLFTVVLSSCGNPDAEKLPTVANDSLPADVAAINAQINSDRNNPDLYFQRAKTYFSHRDIENAMSDMKIVLKIDSTKPDYFIFISDLFFAKNKSRDTRNALRKAVSLDTTNAEALMKYSQLFYLLAKFDTATIYINRSLHFNNSNPVAHFQKGMILKEWGDTVKAISSFQKAVELNQKYYDAYMQLGILHSVKLNPLALGYFDNALSIDSKSIEAHYAKGFFLQSTKEYENALNEYKIILELSPENQDAAFNTGAILCEQKKYDDALRNFDITIKRDKNFFRGYYGRGRCYEAMGQKQKAIDDYKYCLSIKPNYDLAAIQLDFLERRGGK